jgi:PmbA protein
MKGSSALTAECVEALLKAGMDKAEAALNLSRKTELNLEGGKFSLMRTTDDVSLRLTGIKEMRRSQTTLNKTGGEALEAAVAQLVDLVDSGEPDPAVDIAPLQPKESFARGPEEPDCDLMYERLSRFAERTAEIYPTLILEQAILDHTAKKNRYANSNGTAFGSTMGSYTFFAMFTSKEGTSTSSFNYSVVSTMDLERDLWEMGTIEMLMGQSTGQTVTRAIPSTFTGDVIVTPDCLANFAGAVASHLEDYAMITGTSIYRNSLNETVADERLTLRSMPVHNELSEGYFVTDDGFRAENCTLIEKGVLRSFLLGLYGSRKTGLQRSANTGGIYVVDPGTDSFTDMVKSVDRGLLLCRFSGGNPSGNGDFSGVAKNSYYIENGEIRYPVSETMVAGNIGEMLRSVKGISAERVNNGFSIYPWITFSGITVSGK